VFAAGGPGLVVAVAGQPVPDDPRDRYRLLTPLDAPLASREDSVRVITATQDQGLLNWVAGTGHLRRQHPPGSPHHVDG